MFDSHQGPHPEDQSYTVPKLLANAVRSNFYCIPIGSMATSHSQSSLPMACAEGGSEDAETPHSVLKICEAIAPHGELAGHRGINWLWIRKSRPWPRPVPSAKYESGLAGLQVRRCFNQAVQVDEHQVGSLS